MCATLALLCVLEHTLAVNKSRAVADGIPMLVQSTRSIHNPLLPSLHRLDTHPFRVGVIRRRLTLEGRSEERPPSRLV
jgi:hypothetical protein